MEAKRPHVETNPDYLPHIDGLRSISVVGVVLFHFFPNLLPGGFVGVDVFFAISGFLISRHLYQEVNRPTASAWSVISDFYVRRICRIFPALLLLLLASYAVGYWVLLPKGFAELCRMILAGAGFGANFYLASQVGYFAAQPASNPLLHLWSLGVEEQFYVVWPLAVIACARVRMRFISGALFLGALSFFWNESRDSLSEGQAFFLPQMRMWELLVGAVLAAFYSNWCKWIQSACTTAGRTMLQSILSAGGLGLIAFGFIVSAHHQAVPNRWLFLPLGGATLIILGGSSWVGRRMLGNGPMVFGGLISYPLYLWHWLLLSLLHLAWPNPDDVGMKLVAIGGSVALAWGTYRFVEKPLRRTRWEAKHRAGVLAIFMVAMAYLAFVTDRARGLIGRFPPLIQQLSDYLPQDELQWRTNTFFLRPPKDGTDFGNDSAEIKPGRPTLLLWGDSHAAALYPGYLHEIGARYNIVQRTAAAVPPILNFDSPKNLNGRSINDHVFETIKRVRPDYVVLTANWPVYPWRELRATVAALKALELRHIVIVGPVPTWHVSLPQQLSNYSLRHSLQSPPIWLQQGVDRLSLTTDDEMRSFAKELGVEYVSPRKILESPEGIRTRIGDRPEDLMVFDYGHLTVRGSQFLVAQFPAMP